MASTKKSDSVAPVEDWNKSKGGLKKEFDLATAEAAKKFSVRTIALAFKLELPVAVKCAGSTKVDITIASTAEDHEGVAAKLARRISNYSAKL